ncbi:MAG: hypothetical protein O8C64_06180 [Candidatus Methanoperedens sp.]|nr:hypothetical protein [Candidatus Methanoperedens sp.]MCZ7403575.1 hypothetical protein [Candidatus Methanoperedens sp.]
MTEIPEIFVSHSAKDLEYRLYISDICNLAKTRPIFEELEKIVAGDYTFWYSIVAHIERAKAVFVILSQNIQEEENKHTRDWIVWETGVAAAQYKAVWVLEPYSEFGKKSVVIPYLTDYMLFENSNECKIYLKNIIESYSNPSISRPRGINFAPTCQKCKNTYGVHIPPYTKSFRCPICNENIANPNITLS